MISAIAKRRGYGIARRVMAIVGWTLFVFALPPVVFIACVLMYEVSEHVSMAIPLSMLAVGLSMTVFGATRALYVARMAKATDRKIPYPKIAFRLFYDGILLILWSMSGFLLPGKAF